MSARAPLKVLFTWKPRRGLERIKARMTDLDVQVTDDRAEIMKRIGEVEVACVGHFNAEILRAAKKLRWVHAFSGGVNTLIFPELQANPIPLTCLKGCFDIPAAEYALGVMLAFSRKLEYDIRQRPHRKFEEFESTELHGKTVGIVGLGSMGAEIARRCRSFGMRVIGLARRKRACPPEVDQMFELHELPQLLAASDFVIVATPLTTETRGMIGESQLGVMKKTAYLIDVSGRPVIYDLEALTRVLKAGKIAGANLQMVPPSDSPLWELQNLLISFHRIVSREQYDRCVDMFCENLHRYRAGQPLLGLVDKAAGY